MKNELHPSTIKMLEDIDTSKNKKSLSDDMLLQVTDELMGDGEHPYYLIRDAKMYLVIGDLDRAKTCVDMAKKFINIEFTDDKEENEKNISCFNMICEMTTHYISLLKNEAMLGC